VAKKKSKKAGSLKARGKGSKVRAKAKTKTKAKAKTKTKTKPKSTTRAKSKSVKSAKKVSRKKVAKKKTVRPKRSRPSKSTKKKVLETISTGAGAKLAGKVGSVPPAAKEVSAKKVRSKSSPLGSEELHEFRALLLKHRRELLGNVSRMRAETLEKNRQDAAGNLSKFPTSPADLGSDNYELEFTLTLMEGERELLKEIDDALKRIDEGVYGMCEATGEVIARDRLQFEPWARYTVEYASLLEKGLVSVSSGGADESEE